MNNSKDLLIFTRLINILKHKCIEYFGDVITLSYSSSFERDMNILVTFFEDLSIKLLYEITDDIEIKKCKSKSLKDYKLWIKMQSGGYLSIGFDYSFNNLSSPCHLE